MNAVDLPIVATVALFALIGLKAGLLRPISGIGGLILGVFIAVQSSADLAAELETNIEGDTLRRTAAFIGIVILTVVASRLAAFLIKKLLATLVLGWLDHVAGAVAGAALGVVLTGTSVYLLTGANIESTRDALATSRLAPEVSRAKLVSSPKPWCWQVGEGAENGDACTDIMGLFDQYLGRHISETVGEFGDFLEDDAGSIVDVLKTSLTVSPEDLVSLVSDQEVGQQASVAAETAAGLASEPDTVPPE